VNNVSKNPYDVSIGNKSIGWQAIVKSKKLMSKPWSFKHPMNEGVIQMAAKIKGLCF